MPKLREMGPADRRIPRPWRPRQVCMSESLGWGTNARVFICSPHSREVVKTVFSRSFGVVNLKGSAAARTLLAGMAGIRAALAGVSLGWAMPVGNPGQEATFVIWAGIIPMESGKRTDLMRLSRFR